MSITSKNRYFVIPRCAELPKSLSSTAVELLIRNPYNFYARKILGLKNLDRFKDRPNLADFGVFIHAVLDKFTKSYRVGSYKEQTFRFLAVARGILQEMNFHKQELWMHKTEGIAEEFVDFDLSRRRGLLGVWSEEKGSIFLELEKSRIKLTAVADRIELSENGDVYIIDYKTGVVPSENEVKTGVFPQLIVSSIIASRGGFECLKGPALPARITYVKLSSCSPYWKVSDIVLSRQDLEMHLQQLVSLLELLTNEVELRLSPMNDSAQAWDEYSHLSRAFY